ncbi:hypothetical protein GCM10009800_34700 [Nocardiopsis rhodophaea]
MTGTTRLAVKADDEPGHLLSAEPHDDTRLPLRYEIAHLRLKNAGPWRARPQVPVGTAGGASPRLTPVTPRPPAGRCRRAPLCHW